MKSSQITLRGLSPQLAGFWWKSNRNLRIGRDQDYEIVLDNRYISQCHAEVVLDDQGWGVRDLDSMCGTYVNGVRIDHALCPLLEGDVLCCADQLMVVESIRDDAAALPRPESDLDPVEAACAAVEFQACRWQAWPGDADGQPVVDGTDSSMALPALTAH